MKYQKKYIKGLHREIPNVVDEAFLYSYRVLNYVYMYEREKKLLNED